MMEKFSSSEEMIAKIRIRDSPGLKKILQEVARDAGRVVFP